ncbi:MAG: peptidylprolyl isomerase, partial [Bacteroidota bacterium]
LLKFLDSPDPNYRYHAALAFASIQDSTMLNPLAAKLNDLHPEVRAAVAYAVGQSKMEPATELLMDAFDAYDTAKVYQQAHSYILEGVGKCGDEETLELLTGITTYQKSDTLLLAGQVRGIYRLALKNITSRKGTEKMLNILADEGYQSGIRLMAANYLSRARGIDLSEDAEQLSQLIFRETDPNIRMALAIALGKTGQNNALAALEQRFKMESDYRVRCNIVRALINFPYESVSETVKAALKDESVAVAITAATFCRDNGDPDDATIYWRFAKDSVATETVPLLYAAAQRHLPVFYAEYRQALNGELRRLYRDAPNPYLQAAYLESLSEFGWNYRFIQREGYPHEHPVVRSTSVNLLTEILQKDDFRNFFGVSYRNVRREIAVFLKDAIRTDDVGMIAPAASALKDIGQGPIDYLNKVDSSFLEDALVQIELPKDMETFKILRETAERFGVETIPNLPEEEWSGAIDWEALDGLPSNPSATITTNRGAITLDLFPEQSPGSVANFVKLARDGYYENISFHRVVPNFVVQAGCDRGDGNGGVPYQIRSELNPQYYIKEGLLGMARSGYHTESSQFFITHSPTPHLDGGYTIFGEVTEGLDVLADLRKGDQIENITIE